LLQSILPNLVYFCKMLHKTTAAQICEFFDEKTGTPARAADYTIGPASTYDLPLGRNTAARSFNYLILYVIFRFLSGCSALLAKSANSPIHTPRIRTQSIRVIGTSMPHY